MTPLAPCSTSNAVVFPGTTFVSPKSNHLTRYSTLRKCSRQTLSSKRCLLPLSTSVCLIPTYRSGYSVPHQSRFRIVAATGTDVAVEEPAPVVEGEEAGTSEVPPTTSEYGETPAAADPVVTPTSQSKRPRPARKSDMPPVTNEELVPGATFTGKVKSIQPFGAFVDFGAFTDGLVHVSQLSDGFVRDVGSVVSIGQEVKVKLLEANTSNGRISLTMKEGDDTNKPQQRRDSQSGNSSDRPRPQRKNQNQKPSKFVKGQELQGTVKNLTRSGAFISLPEGEEGFLPTSEEVDEGFASLMAGGSSLTVGEEVSVRVLRLAAGRLTLTMKKEVVGGETAEVTEGVVHSASNPFMLAFRKNKDIAAYLDEREKEQTPPETPKPLQEIASGIVETETITDSSDVPDQPAKNDDDQLTVSSVVDDKTSADEVVVEKEVEEVSSTNLNAEESLEEAPISNEGNEITNESESTAEVGNSDEVVEAEADNTIKNEVQAEAPLTVENEIPSVTPDEEEKVEPTTDSNGSVDTSNQQANNPAPQESAPKATISPALVKQLRDETGAGMMDCKKALTETGGDIVKAQEFLRKKGLASADKKASRATAEGRIGSYIHDSRIGILIEVNCETDFVSRGEIFKELVDDLAMQAAAYPQVEYLATDDVPEELVNKEREIEMQKEDLQSKPEQFRSKIVDGRIRKWLEESALLEQPYIKNDKIVVKDWIKQTISTIGENIKVNRFVRYNLGEGLEKKSQDFAAEVAAQTAAKASPVAPVQDQPPVVEAKDAVEKAPAVKVSAALVKQLREETGAGMMDCKKALAETEGDLEKAQEYLRKKGLSTADKKSSRLAAEGRIGSYIHDTRIGVLIEVNCETDFVGRSEKFKELVDDLAMQAVACPQVQYVSIEDIPESIVSKEKDIEMQREDLQSKPENIRQKIVEGRISKRLGEIALLEQPFIKNDSLLVKDLVKQTVAALGENIKVRRFVRFTLGESVKDVKPEEAE
ncbi:hypothetical protein C5167_019720 [Papaver somniferum]|uniref:Elongation factor Ts, mitochondrial n=1 Tax=Papaver somniferum TaxID=3469 RepID=A0A4Y7IUW3_PAPSO|nr:uncharacterized protein LOC113349137 [Papaver somniferum]RZC51289.1 hypothetical protein C5167_019720 [Papaver somniferum]